MWVKERMKQVIQSRRTGKLALKDVPEPKVKAGHVLVKTHASLISAGTERMVIEFAKKNLASKAKARPDLVSAVHVHTGWGTPFSAEARLIEPISQESCIFFEDHTLWDDEEVQVQSVEAGRRIAAAMGQNRAIILRNHGLLTGGDSVAEALGSFVYMERVAEVHMKVRNPKPISAESARFAKEDLTKLSVGRAAYANMLKRHIPNPEIVNK